MFAVLPSSAATAGYGPSSSGWSAHQHFQTNAAPRRNVAIYRDGLDTPWGFRLQGGKDFNTPLTVKRVFSGSPADGRLMRDDLILAINNESVEGLSHAQILEKIKSAGNTVLLTIETSPADPQFDNHRHYEADIVQQSQPLLESTPAAADKETPTSDYDSYQSTPVYSTGQEPSLVEQNRPTHGPYGSAFYPKVSTQSRHRSARRFQAAPSMPSGLSEPGWTPKPKSVPLAQTQAPAAPVAVPPPAVEPPASQHRSARQHQQPQRPDYWKSTSAPAEDPTVPAWYGSLRSTRAPHTWEVRAAKIDSPGEEFRPIAAEPRQHAGREPDHGQSQQDPNRRYKAEIKGLMLSRPAHHRSQVIPEWEGGQDHAFASQGYVHSAPETPTAETSNRIGYKGTEIGHEIQSHVATSYSQPTDAASPAKIQPSVLFGGQGPAKPTPQPQVHTRVAARTQPQETQVTKVAAVPQHVQAPHAVQVPVATALPAPLTPARPTVQQPPAGHAKPQQHLPKIVERFNPGPDRPARAEHAPSARIGQVIEKHGGNRVERFNPGPDRPVTKQCTRVERFNPGPDRPVTKQFTRVERFNPGPDRPVKAQVGRVERFNPGPDRPGLATSHAKPSSLPQRAPATTKKEPAPHVATKYPPSSVEHFNPTPDRPSTGTGQQVERFNPSPTKSAHTAPTHVPGQRPTQTPGQPAKTASRHVQVERFNPKPDALEGAAKPHVQVKHQHKLLERFNPTPERPAAISHRSIQPERFNPNPNKP